MNTGTPPDYLAKVLDAVTDASMPHVGVKVINPSGWLFMHPQFANWLMEFERLAKLVNPRDFGDTDDALILFKESEMTDPEDFIGDDGKGDVSHRYKIEEYSDEWFDRIRERWSQLDYAHRWFWVFKAWVAANPITNAPITIDPDGELPQEAIE